MTKARAAFLGGRFYAARIRAHAARWQVTMLGARKAWKSYVDALQNLEDVATLILRVRVIK